jgi:hydroxypyruvate reductase
VLVVSLATDGTDGPTDAAGGVVTGTSFDEGVRRGLDPHAHLANDDAYPFLREVGDLVVTGPTGTNVCDIVLALVW